MTVSGPCRSYCRATVDFPDPAGPHMKMTRPTAVTIGTSTGVTRARHRGLRLGTRPARQRQAMCSSSQSNMRCSVSSRAIGWQW